MNTLTTTQQTAKHTPLPVRAINDAVITPDRQLICLCYGEQANANAEFIVRACNSHYELLDAAKDALESLRRWPDAAAAYRLTCMAQLVTAIHKASAQGKEN